MFQNANTHDSELRRVLTQIAEQFGTNVLLDQTKIVAYFTDVAPKLSKEKYLLSIFIDCGGPQYLRHALALSVDDQYRLLEELVRKLSNEKFLNVESAQMVVNDYYIALGGKCTLPRPVDYVPKREASFAESRKTSNSHTKYWYIAGLLSLIALLIILFYPKKDSSALSEESISIAINATEQTTETTAITEANLSITTPSTETEPQPTDSVVSTTEGPENDIVESTAPEIVESQNPEISNVEFIKTLSDTNNYYGKVSELYTSSGYNRYIVMNNSVYGIDATGLYCFVGGNKQVIKSLDIDPYCGFCMNSRIAYVATSNKEVAAIDIQTGDTNILFKEEQMLQIIGVGERDVPYILLGLGNDIGGGYSWGYDLYAYDYSGNRLYALATSVEGEMTNGILMYKDYRSDVSPTDLTAISSDGSVIVEDLWICDAIVANNKIYYISASPDNFQPYEHVSLAVIENGKTRIISEFNGCLNGISFSPLSIDDLLYIYDINSSGNRENGRYFNYIAEKYEGSLDDYGYNIFLDTKTGIYYKETITWSYTPGARDKYSLSAITTNGPSKEITIPQELRIEMVYNSYVYGYDYQTDTLGCFYLGE